MFKTLKKQSTQYFTIACSVALLAISSQYAQARSVEAMKATGIIRIGIQADNCPWGCINISGVADGHEADMGRAFAHYLGVKAEFVPLAVSNRIPALLTDKVDVLFATMAMSPERAKAIQFSKPYSANQLSLVGPKDVDLSTADKLAGHVIGVPRSAVQDIALTAIAPKNTEIRRFDDDASNIQALLSGQVEAVGGNQFYLSHIEKAAPGRFSVQLPLNALYNGAGTRLGEKDWNEALNAFLDTFMQSDEYAALYQKYMNLTPPEFPAQIEGVNFTIE